MISFKGPILRATTAAIFAGVLALPAVAATSTDTMQSGTTQSSTPATHHHAKTMSPTERVEGRIKDLHAALKITQDQETQWGQVADAMRQNAQAIEDASSKRTQGFASMTAVDDLKSYEALSEAHADGLKKLVSAFEPLYGSMSAEQKKNADAVFKSVHDKHVARAAAHAGSATKTQ